MNASAWAPRSVAAVGAIAMAAAVLFLAVWAQFEDASVRASTQRHRLGRSVFIGTSSGIGYFLWLWALRHAVASKVTLYLSLSPLTAMLLGSLLLHEPPAPAPALIVAPMLVVLGLWVAQDRRS